MGNICHRLDYDLLKKIARRFENYFLVMIGPTTNDNYKKAGLDKLPNVIFTGNKKLEELPAYLHFAACCIIPFQLIPLTRSIYPLKINEYLSAGKPVVTTNFSEDIATFANIAFVSQSHDDFVDNIETAILEDTDEKATERIAYAAQNNWNSRAIELVKILKSNIHQHAN
jgi:glycosyltransferase involved in cell wall biosynthesis